MKKVIAKIFALVFLVMFMYNCTTTKYTTDQFSFIIGYSKDDPQIKLLFPSQTTERKGPLGGKFFSTGALYFLDTLSFYENSSLLWEIARKPGTKFKLHYSVYGELPPGYVQIFPVKKNEILKLKKEHEYSVEAIINQEKKFLKIKIE